MTLKKEMAPPVSGITRSTKNATKVRSLEVVDKYTENRDLIEEPTFPRFSYFKKPITNIKPSSELTMEEVHEMIISDSFEGITNQLRSIAEPIAESKFKAEKFDHVTFNGTFHKRNDKALKIPSKHFVIDVDKVGEKLMELRKRIISDKVLSPQLVFKSPRGNGLKIVVRISSEIIDYSAKSKIMNPIWQAVNSYFVKEYSDLLTANDKGEIIDGACKDVSRACFLCHDANAYLNVNEVVLSHDFIEANQPQLAEEKPRKTALKSSVKRLVNPSTTLADLARRHLLPAENHHPNLLAFIGAAKTIGLPVEHTLNFINEQVHISAESTCSEGAKLIELANDIYNRYGTDSEGVQYLTQISFGYKILMFKYQKDVGFVLSGLFYDEVRAILHQAGFAKRKIGEAFIFIQKIGCTIKEVNPEAMKGYMTDHVYSIENSICFSYQDEQYQIPPAAIRETFLKHSNNIFNSVWLQHLKINDEPIKKDTENEMFFFFQDNFVTVSKTGIHTEKWDEKNGFCIWNTQIIQHNFSFIKEFETSHFYQFLKNVTNHDEERFSTMITGIGYLLHHHFRESEGQAVIFYDESITDIKTPMGGSGKGLIVNAIKQVRYVTKIDGKHLTNENRFKWELVTPSTEVVWLDDAKNDFDFSILHTNLTDGWTIERKYLSQFVIDPQDSPKTVICSNSIIKGGGSTNRRRQFIIELSDFYSRQIIRGEEKPVEHTHGCIFFNKAAWKPNEWNMFFSLMLHCSHKYLTNGLVYSTGINVELNRFRQATSEDFAEWVSDKKFEKNTQYMTSAYFDEFIGIYYGEKSIGQRTFTSWIKEYASYKKWIFDRKQSNGITYFLFNSI
jgi:hypothetical protein